MYSDMFIRGFLTYLVALGLVIGATSPLWAEENAPADAMRIEVGDGLLSVELGEEVAVGDVLRAIGERADLRVDVRGDLGTVRPQAFDGLPLEEGIRRLIGDRGVGLILLHVADDKGGRRLAEIRAYEAPESASKPPPGYWMPQRTTRLPPPPPPPPPPDLPGAGPR